MKAPARLLELLDRNAHAYEELARNCDLEYQAVQACDLSRLDTLMKEKEQLALKLKMAEEARGALLEMIAAAMRRNAADITLAEIAAAPEGRALKEKLLAAGGRLKKAMDTAREKSDFSRRLIGRALDTVVETIRYANALAGGETATYSNAKTMGGKMRSGVMVTRSY
ncbi:MAG: flagellar protein FlgN [Nitrospinae bacterium]|nr:flagellar protein FlgN [Nitrospinota bacterium]